MLVFSAHALNMLRERSIERTWVQRTVDEPDLVEPNPVHPERTRAFRALPERDGRSLRVVYTRQQDDVRIIILFLNRGRAAKTMNVTYDSGSDALYLRFADAPVADTEEVRPCIMLDFDASGRIVVIEVLDASVHLTNGTELTNLVAA